MPKKINANFVKMISLLNDGEFHDGTTLGEQLGMTRSAVWKAIKKLENYGIKIESIKGKGYALLDPIELLNASKIKKIINDAAVAIHVFESIDSTNHYLKTVTTKKNISICLSEQQTEGKGRFNRAWHSPFAQNIYLSCRYPFQKDISELAGLSLVVSLAIVKALKEIGLNQVVTKWPNDIVYQNKKLAGTLIEIIAETHGISDAIIGIGINVNMIDDENKISQSWISLRKILNKTVDRSQLAANVIKQLLYYLARFNQQGFNAFINEWMATDHLTNQLITLKNINEKIDGTVVGINELGHLILRLENGTTRAFSSGETSIVKKN